LYLATAMLEKADAFIGLYLLNSFRIGCGLLAESFARLVESFVQPAELTVELVGFAALITLYLKLPQHMIPFGTLKSARRKLLI